MKSLFLLAALLFAVALSSASSAANKANDVKKQKAVIQLTQPVEVLGVTLKGEYLFVHDDAAMMRGEACTFIYKGTAEVASKLVVSFHCAPAGRAKVSSFTVRTEQIAPEVTALREFQFAGDKEAHVVPSK
jgi:cytochrome c556